METEGKANGYRIKEYPFGGSNLTTPFHPTSLKFKQTGNSLYISQFKIRKKFNFIYTFQNISVNHKNFIILFI